MRKLERKIKQMLHILREENRCLQCVPRRKYERVDEYTDFTPHFKGKSIHLSGADQIRLMLKSWYSTWSAVMKHEKELMDIHGKDDYDLLRYELLQDFEKRHGIHFVIKRDQVSGYKSTRQNK